MNSAEPLLEIRNLTIRYRTGTAQITAVRDVGPSRVGSARAGHP
jgi:hypothetical protein